MKISSNIKKEETRKYEQTTGIFTAFDKLHASVLAGLEEEAPDEGGASSHDPTKGLGLFDFISLQSTHLMCDTKIIYDMAPSIIWPSSTDTSMVNHLFGKNNLLD